jgi:multidrug resistance efflux pump
MTPALLATGLKYMQFLRRSLVGLFLLSVTFGLLTLAANSFYSALQERINREAFKRPVRERVFAVNTVTITPETISPEITAFGEVLSRRTLDIRASVGGRLVMLDDQFQDGARIEEGTVLAMIDQTDARDGVDVAVTDLAEAQAEQRDAERGLVLARDEVAAAVDQVNLRTQALTRQRNLQERGVGTEAAVENAALSEAAAKQSVLARRQAVAQAQSRLDQSGNRVRRQEINLANARRDLADTEIRASFTGTLAEVAVVEGGLVTPNERLAQIVDPEALEVSFRLSTAQYARLLGADGRLQPAPVTISLDVLGLDLEATGRLSRVGAAVGEGSTGRQIFAQLDSFAGFRPGDFVTVDITEPPLDMVARVPATAVDALGQVLLIGETNRLETAQTEILRRQEDDVLIRAADLTGKQIVSERTPLLGGGVLVRPLAPPPEPGTEQTAQAAPAAPPPPETIALTDERRAKLIAFVEANRRMPAEAKERVLSQLKQDEVPTRVVTRIESRMGG